MNSNIHVLARFYLILTMWKLLNIDLSVCGGRDFAYLSSTCLRHLNTAIRELHYFFWLQVWHDAVSNGNSLFMIRSSWTFLSSKISDNQNFKLMYFLFCFLSWFFTWFILFIVIDVIMSVWPCYQNGNIFQFASCKIRREHKFCWNAENIATPFQQICGQDFRFEILDHNILNVHA